MTPRAETLILKNLYEMHQKGHDVNACLDQSVQFNWQDVYPLKDKPIPDMRPKVYEPEPRLTPEQHAQQSEIRRRVLGAFRLVK
jgi:hypothetical protein